MISINPKNPKKPQPNPEMGSARMKAQSFLEHLNEFHSHIDRIVAAATAVIAVVAAVVTKAAAAVTGNPSQP